MERIKLLFITRDFEHYVERNVHYFALELAQRTDLLLWFEEGNIHEILGKLPERPDFILLNDLKDTRCPKITGLETLDVPFGIIVHDLHVDVPKRRTFMKETNIQHIFTIYRNAFLRTFPEFRDRMLWLPHFVNTELFKDYGLPKDIDWLMMGRVTYYYPLREKILRTMKGRPGFVHHPHPGYRNIKSQGEKAEVFVGEDYSKEINRAKLFLTCDSSLHYPLIKYYEVPACNTLLLAPNIGELRDLGFQPGVHFVEIDRYNFVEKAEYYLHHEEERLKIAAEGHQMVHERHSVQKRADEFVQMVEGILGRG